MKKSSLSTSLALVSHEAFVNRVVDEIFDPFWLDADFHDALVIDYLFLKYVDEKFHNSSKANIPATERKFFRGMLAGAAAFVRIGEDEDATLARHLKKISATDLCHGIVQSSRSSNVQTEIWKQKYAFFPSDHSVGVANAPSEFTDGVWTLIKGLIATAEIVMPGKMRR